MGTFSHRYNKFDIFVIIIGIVATINFVCRYFITSNDVNAGIAFLTLLATSIYAKMSNILGDI